MQRDRKIKLKKADFKLRTYTGEGISPKGLTEVAIKIKDSDDAARPSLVVVATLLGRNWLAQLRIDWSNVNKITKNIELGVLL